MELIENLKSEYGCNEPITTDEILKTWCGYSRPRVFQLLKKYTTEKQLVKFETGIYYIPTVTIFGLSKISSRKVIEKKFIQSKSEVYGYYGGLTLLNSLQLTTQVPNSLEVVSDKAPAVVRDLTVGATNVKVRRARVPISWDNVYTLMLLEALSLKNRPLDIDELYGIKKFVGENQITEKDIYKYAQYFPAKVVKNLIVTGVENVFTQ